MVIHSYRFAMLVYIEHVYLQSISVILHLCISQTLLSKATYNCIQVIYFH